MSLRRLHKIDALIVKPAPAIEGFAIYVSLEKDADIVVLHRSEIEELRNVLNEALA